MVNNVEESKNGTSRRSFLGKGLAVGGAGAIGSGLLSNGISAFAQGGSSSLTSGDVAILKFLSAAEIIESDLWQQYNELGGIKDREIPGPVGKGSGPLPLHDSEKQEACFRLIQASLKYAPEPVTHSDVSLGVVYIQSLKKVSRKCKVYV